MLLLAPHLLSFAPSAGGGVAPTSRLALRRSPAPLATYNAGEPPVTAVDNQEGITVDVYEVEESHSPSLHIEYMSTDGWLRCCLTIAAIALRPFCVRSRFSSQTTIPEASSKSYTLLR